MRALDLDYVLAIADDSPEAPRWSRRQYEQMLLSAPGASVHRTALVAHSNGVLAGFAIANVSPAENLAELETLVVHLALRRRGIGALLLITSKNSAYRAGASAMRLEVRESNAAALSLYQEHGFQMVGRRRSYYSAPVEDALLLQADLQVPGASRDG